jgi:hypothetical protein
MRLMRPVAIGAFSLALLGTVPAFAASPLVPHRAVYDLVLGEANDRSGITGLNGRMVYEFNGSPCDGYTVNFRFVTRIETAETSRLTDQQTTTFEEGNGKAFRFVTKSFTDQSLEREVRGQATLDGDKLKVAIDKPDTNRLELPATQFPTQHLVELIEKAKEGESFYATNLFDGSENADKVMTTTVVLGKKTSAAPSDPELSALDTLAKDQYWPVDIAYFDESKEGGEELPEYRISFKLHENGVTRDLLMDYGDFSMTGKLVSLAFLPPQACP